MPYSDQPLVVWILGGLLCLWLWYTGYLPQLRHKRAYQKALMMGYRRREINRLDLEELKALHDEADENEELARQLEREERQEKAAGEWLEKDDARLRFIESRRRELVRRQREREKRESKQQWHTGPPDEKEKKKRESKQQWHTGPPDEKEKK